MAMPNWMQRLLGSDSMLNFASSMSGTTSAKGMEKMTMSMIEGDNPAFLKRSNTINRVVKI